ncbi:hypothetical protein BN2537_5137 [Streptomyces venezuelae]|nr:hypothetical protein BN2537_5137 [Streptomyces venezuelae]
MEECRHRALLRKGVRVELVPARCHESPFSSGAVFARGPGEVTPGPRLSDRPPTMPAVPWGSWGG